jgi:DNA repair protein RadA/Sms
MPKTHTKYVCSNCGRQAAVKMGRCPNCGEFGTMQEVVEQAAKPASARTMARAASTVGLPLSQPQRLVDIGAQAEERLFVPVEEFSRVLGGGIVPGSIVLLGGEPGAGKSTLLLQAAALLSELHGPVLYVSGEESAYQIKMRADRLKLAAPDLYLVTETNLGRIFEHTQKVQPILLIVDSIQTTYSDDVDASPGLVSQVRECASRLQVFAKTSGVTVFLIGHVTKEGTIAGPRVLEHIVDTVLYLEGDPFQSFRLLRSVKNRFGATSEVGVFEMQGTGMVEVPNPSEAFLAERVVNASGSAIAVTMEGTRPLLVEVQALTSPSAFGNARRTPNGVDMNRLQLIAAVLSKRLGFRLFEHDIFVNVVGGMKVSEPASDLAMAVAIASSYYDRPVPADLAIIGEVGLSGELRAVGQLAARLNEASKIGFRRALVPKVRRRSEEFPPSLQLIECRTIADALRHAVPEEGTPRP